MPVTEIRYSNRNVYRNLELTPAMREGPYLASASSALSISGAQTFWVLSPRKVVLLFPLEGKSFDFNITSNKRSCGCGRRRVCWHFSDVTDRAGHHA